jgi:uncharacterized RDD family membrane protein YckC
MPTALCQGGNWHQSFFLSSPEGCAGARIRRMTIEPKLSSPGLPRRLIALFYDLFLVLPLMMMSVAAFMGLQSLLTGEGAGDLGTPALHPQIVQSIAWLTAALFFGAFWLKGGQTLGMQAWRVKLLDTEGNAVTARHVIIRAVAATFSGACLGLGYLWSLVDRDNRYWHDILSGTQLVLLPKQEKTKN